MAFITNLIKEGRVDEANQLFDMGNDSIIIEKENTDVESNNDYTSSYNTNVESIYVYFIIDCICSQLGSV